MPIRLCPQCSGLELNCEQGMGRNFIKFWTDALEDKWFLKLSLTERGGWLMLLLLAKNGADNGEISKKSLRHLGAEMSCDVKTAGKILSKFELDEKLTVTNEGGVLTVFICNYQYWQDLRGGQRKDKSENNPRKVSEKSQTILPDQTRPDSDQTRPDNKDIVGKADYEISKPKKDLDPHEQLRRQDLEKIVNLIHNWDCMKGVKNPYSIAGKLREIYKNDPELTLQILKEKADHFKLCTNASHLLASATTIWRRDSNMGEIESRAHKQED